MPTISLKVTHGPRWDASQGRHLQNGEVVTLTADSGEELTRLMAEYEVHCREIVSGELPFQETTQEAPQSLPGWSSSDEPAAASEDDEKPKEAPLKPNTCPRCFQTFRSAKGLSVHYRNTNHDKDE